MEETAKKQPTPAFLEKLFDILEDNRSYSHLIAWQPDGNSFIIKKVNEFSEIVLPRYFKHSNIQSYIRQLNMYGFSKTRHDSNHHEFTHKLFQRGRRDLLPMIRRKTQQNSSKTATAGTPTAHSVTAAENNATNKSSFLALASQAQQAPSVQVHVSSEASQSTNGPEDENVDFESSTIIAMQSRILSLEDQVGRLSRICNDLLSQHNYLCEALHQCNTAPTSTRGAGGSGGGGGGDGDGGGNVSGKGNTPACSESSKSSSTLSASASEGTTSASSPASGPTKRRLGENGADNDELKVDEEMIRGSPLKRMRSVDTASLIPIAQMTFRNGGSGSGSSSRSGDSSNNGSVKDSDDDEKRMTVFAVKSERGASISSNTDATTVSASSTSMSTASRAGSQGPLSTTNSNNSSSAVAVDFLDFRVKKAQLPPFVSDVYKIAIVTHAGAATGGHQQQHRAQQHVYTHGDPDFALLMAKAGGNFDLGGLEAITNAATFLDHDEDTDGPHGGPLALSSCIDESTLRVKYPLFTASALAASNLCSSQVSASAAVATANGAANEAKDAQRGDDAAASFARAGAPLTKAYSIG